MWPFPSLSWCEGLFQEPYSDGLRSRKTVNSSEVRHIWDGSQIALEMNAAAQVTNKYVRGINLLYAEDGTGQAFYLFNGHGDVVQLTDALGIVVKSYDYDAFGNEKNLDPSDLNVFRYCGEYFDNETGTIYLRARYYDPVIGRFVTEDSYRGDDRDPLSLNLYTYCHNNPVILVDPEGDNPLIGGLIGGVIGGALGLWYGYEQTGELWSWETWKFAGIGALGGTAVGAGAVLLGPKIIAALAPAAKQLAPEIGEKWRYLFGKATGDLHNIERSQGLLKQLGRIGIQETQEWISYVNNAFVKAYYDSTNVFLQENSRLVKESLLLGPDGILKMQTIWEGAKLITIYLFGKGGN